MQTNPCHLVFPGATDTLARPLGLPQVPLFATCLSRRNAPETFTAPKTMTSHVFSQLADGRTDVVFDYLAAGNAATAADADGVSLIRWCAYHGDVSAIRFLLANGESINALGENLDLNGAVFHGHAQLTRFLIEQGADVNFPMPDTAETPLHSALCKTDRRRFDPVLAVLLDNGANPNCVTRPSVATEGFMRDCRTKGETPLHRAAAFGGESTIDMLLAAGAIVDAKDMHGDSPLSWASWYLRPRGILRKLCYGHFHVS